MHALPLATLWLTGSLAVPLLVALLATHGAGQWSVPQGCLTFQSTRECGLGLGAPDQCSLQSRQIIAGT